VLPKLESLSAYDLAVLAMLGRDEAEFILGKRSYAGLRVPEPDSLIEGRLIREAEAPGGEMVHVLTGEGRMAARILLAKDVPSSKPPQVATIRESARELDKRTGDSGRIFDDESHDQTSPES
jgi:hypothetical protein